MLLQGHMQYINLEFERNTTIESLDIRFQGGFAAATCVLCTNSASQDGWHPLYTFYPVDSSNNQVHLL